MINFKKIYYSVLQSIYTGHIFSIISLNLFLSTNYNILFNFIILVSHVCVYVCIKERIMHVIKMLVRN